MNKILLIFLTISCMACQNEQETQLRKQISSGKLLYQKYCINCHKEDGMGFEKAYPPLAKADYLLEDPKRAACIIKYGMSGPIQVNGQPYNLLMPANEHLTEVEIAQILTYITNFAGNKEGFFGKEFVEDALNSCKK